MFYQVHRDPIMLFIVAFGEDDSLTPNNLKKQKENLKKQHDVDLLEPTSLQNKQLDISKNEMEEYGIPYTHVAKVKFQKGMSNEKDKLLAKVEKDLVDVRDSLNNFMTMLTKLEAGLENERKTRAKEVKAYKDRLKDLQK